MAQSLAQINYGTNLKIGNGGSPETFTALLEVTSMSGFGSKRNLLDVTHMDSPNGFKEWFAAMKDGSEFSAVCNFKPNDPTQGFAAGLIADHNAGTRRNMQLVQSTALGAGTWSFTCIVTGWDYSPSPDEIARITYTMKITGAITYA